MIELNDVPKNLKAKDFYAELERVSGKKLHKDFNCTPKFNDDGSIDSIAITGLISSAEARHAAGFKDDRIFSVGNFFRNEED